jgi:uncharacterized hydrophobic protein (TIGR00271 family)
MAEKNESGAGKSSAVYQHEDLRLSAKGRSVLYHSVLEASRLDPEYLTMLALSSLIALLGLLQNSAAVIIGAMLISPLMNPILAAALALVLGDGKLGRRTAIILGLSIGGAILITWIVASLIPLKQATPEILARANPNLLDLFIAVLSGLAGTLALRSGSSSLMIIPGVAIAVAVIPPLGVVGFGLGSRGTTLAAGAFLLFITNLVSIIISAAVVFLLMGFRPRKEAEMGRLRLPYRMAISALVLGVLSIPLFQTLRRAVGQFRLRSDVVNVLNRAFQTDHSSVTDLNYSRRGKELLVRATLRTTEYFDAKDIQAAEESLRRSFGPDTKLEIDQILVTQGGLTREQVERIRNFISGGVVQPAPKPPEPTFDFKKSQEEILSHLQELVDQNLVLASAPFRAVAPIRAELGVNQPATFFLQLASTEPLENQTVQLLSGQLSAKLSSPVELHGEVELEGEQYALGVEAPSALRGLTLKDRQAVGKLLAVAHARPDLRVQITVAPAEVETAGARAPLLVRQVRTLLTQSPLKSSQWAIEAVPSSPAQEPPASGAQAEATPPATTPQPKSSKRPIPVRCEFKVYQDF